MFQYDHNGNPVVVGVVSMSLATDCGSSEVPGAYVRTAPHAWLFAGKQGVQTVTETNALMTDFRPPPTFRRIIILVLASVAAVTAVLILAVGAIRIGRRRHRRKKSTSPPANQGNVYPPPSVPPPVAPPAAPPAQSANSSSPELPPVSNAPSEPSVRSPDAPEQTVAAAATEQPPIPMADSTSVPPALQAEGDEPLHVLDIRVRESHPSMVDMSLSYDPYACARAVPEPQEATEVK